MKKNTLFIVIIIITAFGIGLWRDDRNNSSQSIDKITTTQPLHAGTYIPNSQKLSSFSLIDMHGNPFTENSLKQRWSFVFFGYSSCPNICPTVVSSLQELSQKLRGNPHIQFLYVTINPEVDTMENLKNYLQQEKFANTRFLGITGEKDKILHFAKMMGTHIERENQEEHFEHSGTLYLIDPEGKLTAIFTSNSNPTLVANDFKEIAHRFARMM